MKKQIASHLVLLITAGSFLISCGNRSAEDAGALEFDSIQVNRTVHLFGDTAKPACNLILNLTYADKASDDRLKDSINAFLLSLSLGDEYAAVTPQEAVDQYAREYAETYRNDLEAIYEKDEQESEASGEEMGSWYAYYQTLESRVQLYRKHLLVYRVDYTEYTGGAHGIYMSTFFNLDLRSMMPVRLDDLFVPEYQEPLTNMLWLKLMADNDVSSREELEEMGFASTGNLSPTENFFLSNEGITFYYNVYDIAPYVMGPTEIELSYNDIAHLLSDDLEILKGVRRY